MQAQSAVSSARQTRAQSDEGLRAYMLEVYNYMAGGLAVTGVVAYAVSTVPALLHLIFSTPLSWVVALAPLGILIYISVSESIDKHAPSTVQTLFWVYAGLMGLSLSSVFVVYTGASIARVFFITAGTFGAMSLYGYTTRKDLSGWGNFLFMGLIGIILASVVNIFLGSPALYYAVSVIGVIVFIGLTAHDTQAIKELYRHSDPEGLRQKKAIFGALLLYLDFLNLLLQLLASSGEGGE